MAKKSPRRRRRSRVSGLNTANVGKVVTAGLLPGVIGAIAVKYLAEKFLPAEYAQYADHATGLVGLAAASGILGKNAMLQAGGLGAATVAGYNIGKDALNIAGVPGLGLLAPGHNFNPSLYPGFPQPGAVSPL